MKKFKEYVMETMTDPEATVKELKGSLENAGIDYKVLEYDELVKLLGSDFSKKEASLLANMLLK